MQRDMAATGQARMARSAIETVASAFRGKENTVANLSDRFAKNVLTYCNQGKKSHMVSPSGFEPETY